MDDGDPKARLAQHRERPVRQREAGVHAAAVRVEVQEGGVRVDDDLTRRTREAGTDDQTARRADARWPEARAHRFEAPCVATHAGEVLHRGSVRVGDGDHAVDLRVQGHPLVDPEGVELGLDVVRLHGELDARRAGHVDLPRAIHVGGVAHVGLRGAQVVRVGVCVAERVDGALPMPKELPAIRLFAANASFRPIAWGAVPALDEALRDERALRVVRGRRAIGDLALGVTQFHDATAAGPGDSGSHHCD